MTLGEIKNKRWIPCRGPCEIERKDSPRKKNNGVELPEEDGIDLGNEQKPWKCTYILGRNGNEMGSLTLLVFYMLVQKHSAQLYLPKI